MNRYILIYGSLAGTVLAASFAIGFVLGADIEDHSPITGYLIMIVALSLIFVGVKRYRDRELGGVIRFGRALGAGLGMAAIASLFYVIGWEIYMYATDYSFMGAYVDAMVKSKQAAGENAAAIVKFKTEMQAFEAQYANPLYRIPITFVEVAPVGIVAALISAGLLRNSKFLPAKSAA